MLRKLLAGALGILAVVCGTIVLFVMFLFTQFPTDRTPRYSVVLDMQGPASATNLEVWVTEPGNYAVALHYPYGDGGEREKAWALAGGDARKGDTWSEPGSALVFQVRIQEIESGIEMLDQQVMHPKLNSWAGNYLSADLVKRKLETGHYQVTVQREGSLADTPPAPLEIHFGKAHQGK
ncbi:DUF5625 family protein [Pseudomonas sp. Irchel 3A5]|uniref:DUF5625 family protein n=1 Tax=Pseudomonas sp. Irchel 3A5 TaxID=2008911 RepID=UPI000BA36EAB|nr:DUF5625 family protein [Pseudomonas sp. Irchel 3A5]